MKSGNWGETESENWNLIIETELWVTNCALFPFLFEFYCVLFFITLVSVQYGSLCYCWGVWRWYRWLYNFVTVFYVTVWLCWTGYIFRHNRKAFLNNDSFVMLVCWVSHLCEMARFWQRSLEIPHSSLTSSFSQLHMLRLVVAACGTKAGLPKWTARLRKTLAFTWEKIFHTSSWNNRFLRVHIYK